MIDKPCRECKALGRPGVEASPPRRHLEESREPYEWVPRNERPA